MPVNKRHAPFCVLDLTAGWVVPNGYPSGITQKVISGALDEENRRGSRTRLLKVEAGVSTSRPFEHEYWEELYVLSGEMTVGVNAQGQGGARFPPNTYACHPPHTPHGPFKSETGCILLEIHYFDPA